MAESKLGVGRIASNLDERISFSIKEVVRASGLGRTMVYREIGLGKLKARKSGRRTIILSNDLAAWLEGLPKVGFASSAEADDDAK